MPTEKKGHRKGAQSPNWGTIALWAIVILLALYLFGQQPAAAATDNTGDGGEVVEEEVDWPALTYEQTRDSICGQGAVSFWYNGGEYNCPVAEATEPVPSGSTTSSEACLPLDKIGTWSENPQGLVHRIEVGGHGGQHMDFYPEVGVKAVSYIISEITPPEVAAIWWGYGSNWEGNPPGCTFDWIADATAYAEARLDSGHSGLVVDWRSGEPVVVANVAGLSQAQIDALLELHYDGMDTTP